MERLVEDAKHYKYHRLQWHTDGEGKFPKLLRQKICCKLKAGQECLWKQNYTSSLVDNFVILDHFTIGILIMYWKCMYSVEFSDQAGV